MCPKIGVGFRDSKRSICRRPPSDRRGSEICGPPGHWPCLDRSDSRMGAPVTDDRRKPNVPWSVSGQLARIRIHVLTWPLGRYGREVLPAGSVVMHHTRFKHRTRGVAKWTQRARNVHLRGSHGAYRSELGLDRAMGRWVIELGLRGWVVIGY